MEEKYSMWRGGEGSYPMYDEWHGMKKMKG